MKIEVIEEADSVRLFFFKDDVKDYFKDVFQLTLAKNDLEQLQQLDVELMHAIDQIEEIYATQHIKTYPDLYKNIICDEEIQSICDS